ncbi:MAG: hypothetical protein JWR54_1002 [Mucilaginibacter sp.]|nr:hypothetical protein [Mucilaginibacter sp.]
MRHFKFFSTAIVLSMVALLAMSWKPIPPTPTAGAVTITAVYDFSTFPNVSGTFTTSGALNISGTSTMDVGPNINGIRAHCVVVLVTPEGTITIHQECVFATNPPQGRWEIVSGTGAYANLQGNGTLTMPPNTEAMTGFIR